MSDVRIEELEREVTRLAESNELLLAAWEEAQGEVASIHEALNRSNITLGRRQEIQLVADGADRVFSALCRNWPAWVHRTALSKEGE